MGLITKEVETKWTTNTKQRYIDKGYSFTKIGDALIVSVSDLCNGSNIKVIATCEHCGKEVELRYYKYLSSIRQTNNIYHCGACVQRLFNGEKIRNTRLKNSKSLLQWYYENFDAVDVDVFLKRWDYDLNKCSPSNICYGTGKKYWFKCLDNEKHMSELKNINTFTSRNHNSIKCNQCNVIGSTHPHLTKYFVNKSDVYKYSYASEKSTLMRCPDCGFEQIYTIKTLTMNGYYCRKCGDGISYPEKFIFSLLEQLNIRFVFQFSKAHENWCGSYRYDYYIPDKNIIIEVHGDQHYSGWNSKSNLYEINNNDNNKKDLALQNGITNYIVLNASKSECNFIKSNVLNSELSIFYNLDIIDWEQCEIHAISNLTKYACDLWNSGFKSTNIIADKMKLSQTTITRYLKLGANLGMVDYDSKLTNSKRIICLNTDEVFNSISEAKLKYKHCDISSCLTGRAKTAGKHPETGEPLRWLYYNDYINEMKAG